ncbi:response regulator transcription factor [Tessaracoccus sp. OH4464_COT-324]|uniref:response regulator transcription factor n=1 Tax=Tessaracoccus sp. OH4464_COT-324 TaxID=2491059 RepID=UPI000F62D901|nr:response regulator transcription factor [Tessaracoccus sp. OH4464_COT-324]RRD47085.1 DNA-binding response regulator [Tessaracoccus sp. OH4464_COT-324]
MIEVVIADDHPVVRAGLRALVEAQPDMTVVRDFDRAEALVDFVISGGQASVLLLDLRFGAGLSGAEATRAIVAGGGPPVLILTTYDTDGDILSAIEAGATGYLLKDSPTEELTAAIRAAAAGEVTLGPSVQRRLLGRMRAPMLALSARELEVLQLVADGASNDAIAARLVLSRATVKTHLTHIYEKLGVGSRTEAVAVARRRGVLAP